jgi:hypothetical protein
MVLSRVVLLALGVALAFGVAVVIFLSGGKKEE